jgi:RNA polymerase sigma-70 factor (ECF subfamily)
VADDDLERCLGGDASACDRLAGRHRPGLVASAWRVLRRYDPASPAGDAEDVAQDVFLRLFRDDRAVLRRFDAGRSSFATWLSVIARGLAIDLLRRRRSHPAIEAAAAAPAPAVASDELPIPEGLLTGRQRLVLELLFARGLEVDEAARLLAVEPQTVRSAKHKALKALRAHYRREDV